MRTVAVLAIYISEGENRRVVNPEILGRKIC